MSKILILDTETTGLTNHPVHGHPQVIELAYVDVSTVTFKELKNHLSLSKKEPGSFYASKELYYWRNLYKPSMPIHPQATEIHGKTIEDLQDPLILDSEDITLPETKYIIGHNISYDLRCLNKKELKSICTLNLIKSLKKVIPSIQTENNKLDTLISWYFPEEFKIFNGQFHNAMDDCYKVILLLIKMEELLPKLITWDDLYNFQNKFKEK